MPSAYVRGALSVDGYLRLRARRGDVLHEAVPQRRLFVQFTEQPVTHPVVDGQANIGDGHRAFTSGASVMPVARPARVCDDRFRRRF
jgi:hypothetical protein